MTDGNNARLPADYAAEQHSSGQILLRVNDLIVHTFPVGTLGQDVECWTAAFEQGRLYGFEIGHQQGAEDVARGLRKLLLIPDTRRRTR